MKFPLYPVPRKQGGISPIFVHDLADILALASGRVLPEPAVILEVHGGETYPVHELFKMVSEHCVKRTRFPVGGVLADSMLPFLERDRRNEARSQKLQHFLALGSRVCDATHLANPLVDMVPERMSTFKEKMADN